LYGADGDMYGAGSDMCGAGAGSLLRTTPVFSCATIAVLYGAWTQIHASARHVVSPFHGLAIPSRTAHCLLITVIRLLRRLTIAEAEA